MDVISRYGKNYKYNKWDPSNWDIWQILLVITILWGTIFAGCYYYTNFTIPEDRVSITKQLQSNVIPIGSQLTIEYIHLTKEDIDTALEYGYEIISISNLPKDRSLVVYRRVK